MIKQVCFKMTNRERKGLSELYNEDDLKYGYIICKCNLVDCIYMTEEFIKQEKEKNPKKLYCWKI